ncbi:hypothetical protein AG1IA_00470 [Rhizoctonia solani AG-1 IA]|uniref:Uncharacterized protein n=1 Tax=Thanatephorus cucumeris (strain AG1-IA) TaxID=983506 RepID=L8X9Z1_THACA|nr:hypothetical protein AG1IA_00470 [Rhizoctonia solani AG-1 IA]
MVGVGEVRICSPTSSTRRVAGSTSYQPRSDSRSPGNVVQVVQFESKTGTSWNSPVDCGAGSGLPVSAPPHAHRQFTSLGSFLYGSDSRRAPQNERGGLAPNTTDTAIPSTNYDVNQYTITVVHHIVREPQIYIEPWCALAQTISEFRPTFGPYLNFSGEQDPDRG